MQRKGRPPSNTPNKRAITMTLDPDVIEWIDSQSMYRSEFVNEILRREMETQTMNTETQTITIKDIATRPEIDPYHRDTGGITRTCIRLDPQERELTVYQDYDDNATPANVWHGIIHEWSFSEHPKEDDMRAWLEENMNLFEAIVNGHEVVWSGSNHVGSLSPEALNASEQIEFALDNDGLMHLNYYQLWQMEEWLESVEDDAIGKTDAEIREMADEAMTAGDDYVILGFDADDAYEYLIRYRDEHTDDE